MIINLKLKKTLAKWHLWLEKHDINPVDAAISFVLKNTNLDNRVSVETIVGDVTLDHHNH